MNIELLVLGTGSATPQITRHPSAYLLCVENEYFLIDCGEGTQFRLLEYKIKHTRIRNIFISHLHGDHYFGLVGLISSWNLNHRTEDLTIFGPQGLNEIITVQLKYSQTVLNFKLNFVETTPSKSSLVLDHPLFTVETIPLFHRIPCNGYVFRGKSSKRKILKEKLPENFPIPYIHQLKDGQDVYDELSDKTYLASDYTTEGSTSKSFAYCSDTAYHESVIEHVKNVDLLYHEATFTNEHEARAIKTNHSTARQAAIIAHQAGVKKLVIGHYSSRYKDLDIHLAEAKEVFEDSHLAIEGKTYLI